ncbi:hypothetical protein CEXT_488941 [Caerostris extrusa]|uniref:Uncharacterized protein n=1 Tax=Caerostris extrusa TaxID=172846 RepID=A0AAV4S7T5_CAEEX|nr:hypothetical protein CEXT_488941 [Caerostris extrusa]
MAPNHTPKIRPTIRKTIRKWIRVSYNFDLMQSIAVVYLNRDYEPPPWGQAGKGFYGKMLRIRLKYASQINLFASPCRQRLDWAVLNALLLKDAVLLLDVLWGIQLC